MRLIRFVHRRLLLCKSKVLDMRALSGTHGPRLEAASLPIRSSFRTVLMCVKHKDPVIYCTSQISQGAAARTTPSGRPTLCNATTSTVTLTAHQASCQINTSLQIATPSSAQVEQVRPRRRLRQRTSQNQTQDARVGLPSENTPHLATTNP